MGRPREHGNQTRTNLLDAAERLLGDTGPDALSIRAVADAAGTTTRAVYALFGSKSGMLDALAVNLFEALGSAIDQVPESDDAVADLVAASVRGFRKVMLEHAPLYRLVFGDVVPRPTGEAAQRSGAAAFARLEELIARVLPDGLSDKDVHTAAVSVHALTEGLAAVELRGALGGRTAAKRVWEHSVAALAAGFASA